MSRCLLLTTLAIILGFSAGCGSSASNPGTAGGGSSAANPVVLMETSMGNIKIALYADKAPITVTNFLEYVADKHYDGTIFHRVLGKENSDNGRDFMIQGGGFLPGMTEKPTRGNIKNEADNGLSNLRGTVAMARTPDPHGASAQFFINVATNTFLDHQAPTRQGYGYCVFGKVIEGMDVVDRIKAVPTQQVGGHEGVPVQDVVIKSVRRVP